MTGRRRDPVGDWADVSARAARATGLRVPLPLARRRPATAAGLGALTIGIAVIVAALVLRPAADGAVAATVDDGAFRLSLSTPRERYGPTDAIEPVATVMYLGPDAAITVRHTHSQLVFQIEEVSGIRGMGGASRSSCESTTLVKDEPLVVPFVKSGSPDDPTKGFDLAWYQDPTLTLPVGTWRITVNLDFGVIGCGTDHALRVSNVIRVVDATAPSGAPSSTPASASASPSPSPSPSRGPEPSPDAPVAAGTDDGVFRLDLTAPRAVYGPDDPIEAVARITYLGPNGETSMYHGSSPVGFTIQEIGGTRAMGGGMDQPCLSTAITKDVPLAYPLQKAGSPDQGGFDRAWYLDPVLRLPTGTWRIRATLYVDVTDGTKTCGGIHHEFDVVIEVTVR